jgi:RNA polymerase sigma-70 factor (ECF subfamily)
MATTVDYPADSDSLLASRDPGLTARFVNEALPYLNQLRDSARRMTHNAVDAEDLVQEGLTPASTPSPREPTFGRGCFAS